MRLETPRQVQRSVDAHLEETEALRGAQVRQHARVQVACGSVCQRLRHARVERCDRREHDHDLRERAEHAVDDRQGASRQSVRQTELHASEGISCVCVVLCSVQCQEGPRTAQ